MTVRNIIKKILNEEKQKDFKVQNAVEKYYRLEIFPSLRRGNVICLDMELYAKTEFVSQFGRVVYYVCYETKNGEWRFSESNSAYVQMGFFDFLNIKENEITSWLNKEARDYVNKNYLILKNG